MDGRREGDLVRGKEKQEEEDAEEGGRELPTEDGGEGFCSSGEEIH